MNISSQFKIILKRESVLVDRKEVTCIKKDGGEERTKTNQKTGEKRK